MASDKVPARNGGNRKTGLSIAKNLPVPPDLDKVWGGQPPSNSDVPAMNGGNRKPGLSTANKTPVPDVS